MLALGTQKMASERAFFTADISRNPSPGQAKRGLVRRKRILAMLKPFSRLSLSMPLMIASTGDALHNPA
jgi:hypothetical protein